MKRLRKTSSHNVVTATSCSVFLALSASSAAWAAQPSVAGSVPSEPTETPEAKPVADAAGQVVVTGPIEAVSAPAPAPEPASSPALVDSRSQDSDVQSVAAASAQDKQAELEVAQARSEAKIDALADSLGRLRESMAIPATEELRSVYGLGPAASKVYGIEKGLSIGGYGEAFLGHYLGKASERNEHRGDAYRAILYTGYKFTDKLVMNTELEFEHGTTAQNPANGSTGSVSLEFAYVDYLLSDALKIRSGLMLVPMGITNELHEPTVYRGNMRPESETTLIPSTWRELGVGIFGDLPAGFSYKLYGMSGMSAAGFGATGYRGGRQSGNRVVFEDQAAVAQLSWDYQRKVNLGTSFYFGGADQDKTRAKRNRVRLWIYEAHGMAHFGGFEARALFAINSIDGAAKLDTRTPEQIAAGEADPTRIVPTQQMGGYVEAAYDIFRPLGFSHQLSLFGRYERLNLQSDMIAGQTVDKSRRSHQMTGGLEYKPHSQIVVKAEYAHKVDDAKGKVQEIRVGTGFVF